MISLTRNIVAFCIGILIGRGFTNKDLLGIIASVVAGVAYVAFIAMM